MNEPPEDAISHEEMSQILMEKLGAIKKKKS